MKKMLHLLLLAALFSVCLMGFALADVAAGPMFTVVIGVPLAIIAAAVIIITIVIKAVRKREDRDREKSGKDR